MEAVFALTLRFFPVSQDEETVQDGLDNSEMFPESYDDYYYPDSDLEDWFE